MSILEAENFRVRFPHSPGGVLVGTRANVPALVATGLYLMYVTSQAEYGSPLPGLNFRDNANYAPPPIFLKAEDKTDYMGKPKGNTPGNNQAQNAQTDALAKKYGLTKDQQRRLHDRISGEGLGYKEIEKIIIEGDY